MLTRILAVAAAILAAVAIHFYSQNAELRAQVVDAQTSAVTRARHLTAQSLAGQGAEIQRVMVWLDAFYKSQNGLQRPQGLWVGDHPDYEGISYWVFDSYFRDRLNGMTEADAEARVVAAIKASDEWRVKHQPKG